MTPLDPIDELARQVCDSMSDAVAERIARLTPEQIPLALSPQTARRYRPHELDRLRAEISRRCRVRRRRKAG